MGLKVCLVEQAQLGGTCLNLGCIPAKALIQSAKVYSLVKKSSNFGIEPLSPVINFAKAQERKEQIISQLRLGMQSMLPGIDFLSAEAKILSNQEIQAAGKVVQTKFMLIACGSRPIELSAFKFDGKKIISSNEIINLKTIPSSLLIIGGGVIGCEFANLFNLLGTKVTVVEKMPQLLPTEDLEVARKIEALFKKKGIKVNTNTDATSLNLAEFELVLVCVGRVANTEGLDLARLGLKLDKARIVVDEYLKTSIENIYASGDCTAKIMLAHYAAYQGSIAAQNITSSDNPRKADNKNVPNCIFTDPEIASVGLSEQAAKNLNLDIGIRKFDFMGSGMARILDETEGFIKIILDKKTDEIIGASIVGPKATELIGILGLAVSNRLKAGQVRDTIFVHPSLSESIHESLK